MANFCSTKITITYHDTTKLEEFYTLVSGWLSTPLPNAAASDDWLGKIVLLSGIGTIDTNPATDLYCGAFVHTFELNGNQLNIQMGGKSTPALQVWLKLADKYFSYTKLTYSAEVEGYPLFITNDKKLIGTYHVEAESYFGNDISGESITKECIIGFLQYTFNTCCSDIDGLLYMLDNSEHCSELAIHKWKYVDARDCC